MVVRRHRRHLVGLHLRGCRKEGVGALDGAADPAFGDDAEHTGVGEGGDVAVEASDGHVTELAGELRGGELAIAEERLDDAEADGMEEEVCAGHRP